MKIPNKSHEWLLSYERPWIVIDWGCLRAMTSGNGLPPGFTAVIPDMVFLEAATTETARRKAFVHKLRSVIEHPSSHGRILVGRYWDEVARQETRPSIPAVSAQIIEKPLSLMLAEFQRGERGFREVTFQEPEIEQYRYNKEVFVKTANHFLDDFREREPDNWRQLSLGKQKPASMIQGESEMMYEYLSKIDGKFRRKSWEDALSQYPDRFAVPRWLRLIAWYCLVRASLPEQNEARFGNNFEDAHYAFLSLYTNHLWTADKGMAAAARAVSADRVRVYSSLEDLPGAHGGEEPVLG